MSPLPSLPLTTIQDPLPRRRRRAPRVLLAAAGRGFGLALLATAGCGSVSKTAGHVEVDQLVAQRIGARTHWDQGSPDDQHVARWIDESLRGGLTRERAVAIALLNNPALQEAYEELGVSQADLVQAGLLSNPSIGGHVEFATSGGGREVQVSLVQNFLDLVVLPARKRIARAQFEAEVVRVAHQALETAAEVTKEVVATEAAARLVALRQTAVDATDAAAALAEKQLAAGNVSELREASEQVLHAEAVLDLVRDQTELLRHRERLDRLLGLWGARTDWTLAEELPPLAPAPAPSTPATTAAGPPEPSLDALETQAINQRLDVDAARKQRLLLGQAVELARRSRFFGRVEVGVDAHQFPDGPRVFGPSLVLELPIFDQRQALIARLEAQERQAERHLTAVSVTTRSEVRLALAEVLAARRIAEQYRGVVLPLRDRIVEQAQLHYDGMLIGLYQFLQLKRDEIEAQAHAITAVRDYWIARADLDRAVGGRIREAAPLTTTNGKQP